MLALQLPEALHGSPQERTSARVWCGGAACYACSLSSFCA
ncbi:hypothetical protein VARIO8X_110165 [Burkholderiales bacterium 8X]|nr:hypothetical protein VARIO8X_110165 [Burkholderiales bacterium 8X]